MDLNQKPVETVDLTEAGPTQRDVEIYRSPARGQLTFPQWRPVLNVTRRRDGSNLAVPEEAPKFLGEFILLFLEEHSAFVNPSPLEVQLNRNDHLQLEIRY